jgi:hypothetical protein
MDTHDPRRPHDDAAESVDEIDQLFGGAFPNPEREGCPGREVLAALAHERSSMDDPVYEHLQRCSPCYTELRELQRSVARSAQAIDRSTVSEPLRSRWLLGGLAAALLLLAISAAVWRTWFAATPQPVSAQAELDLRPYGANRGNDANSRKPLVVRRAVIAFVLILPTGSEPGTYDIRVFDSKLQSRASATGTAEIRDYVTTIKTTLDLRALSAGSYRLALRRDGENWRFFPAQVE